MKPVVLKTVEEMKIWRQKQNGSCGFVPTMGALHAGHAKLLQRARAENEIVILSIFVNPTQFNNADDLQNYPKTWSADLELAEKQMVDAVFAPSYDELYPDHYHYRLIENELSLQLCGKDRPGHFDGVLTVVLKLLNLTQAQRAYFGEKDFQQLSLVRGLTEAFFLPCQIIAVPTEREEDGLAMSSRNLRLTPEQRILAPQIHAALAEEKTAALALARIQDLGLKVDYIEDHNNRRFAAVHVGEVRLIDNIEL